MNQDLKIILCEDGSHTLLNSELNETYHSQKGAVAESEYVYIENGIKAIANITSQINILEIGFGTGLNLGLTFQYAAKYNNKLIYHSLEPHRLDNVIIKSLNYSEYLDSIGNEYLNLAHTLEDSVPTDTKLGTICIYEKRIEDYISNVKYDVVYFDAFAPSKQAEIWNIDVFRKLYSFMNIDGIITTYCSAGQVKRNMKEAGFDVIKLPGPLGKREMLRGIKIM